MAKINILPAQVYNRIAAGEVVDRPYSVVKELVENAIDAGASEVEIYIEQGGKQLIRVVDNGGGIERDDLHSAFLPHATSKIKKAEDLENILTLGFRGEAVASIASVSKMTITSKTKDGKCYALTSEFGKIGNITEAAGQDGTDVKVEMLFGSTPVRLKFLKTDKAEETEITNFVSRFILCRPEIAFTYYVNGKKVLQSFGGGEDEAFASVYGTSTLQNCYKIDAQKNGIRIRGYIGNQNYFKPNKTYQSMFLNGRYVLNITLSTALHNAYKNYVMKRQYPFYVLYVTMPTEVVDVNVHPNKSDVRFADNNIVFASVYSVISSILDGKSSAMEYLTEDQPAVPPTVELPAPVTPTEPRKPIFEKTASAPLQKTQEAFGFASLSYEEAKNSLYENNPSFRSPSKLPAEKLPFNVDQERESDKRVTERKPTPKLSGLQKKYPDLYFERNILEVNDSGAASVEKAPAPAEETDIFAANKRFLEELDGKAKQNKIDIASCVFVGKLFNTYLLYERGDEIYMIDQHAAHERLIFNRLKENMINREVVKQPMLLPFRYELNAFESAFISENLENIRAMGFDIEADGESAFEVFAVPLDLQFIDLSRFFNELLADISGFRSIRLEELLKDKLAMAACKAAVKGGMDLTKDEIDSLFKLMDGDMGLKCPHGRPVVVKMAKTEIEKMFKRIV
ncbi:MAG: DNA mismatch repair endonuclease MutL [Clostridia bacterium]|nr:DNA mismatch repair endonuclease MutL [Clostridia bacterium]